MTCSWNGLTMWYLLVPLIVVFGVGATYALVAPLRRHLSQPLPADPTVPASPVQESMPPAEDERLTKEMVNEWIRECRSDDT